MLEVSTSPSLCSPPSCHKDVPGPEHHTPAPVPCTAQTHPQPAGSPGARPSPSHSRAVEKQSQWLPASHHWNPLLGYTHRLPPGARRVQPTAIAELQTAGVRHTCGIVHLKPVCVVGDTAAAELGKGRSAEVGEPAWAVLTPPQGILCLTSVWMMLQALVSPTLPGVPYRCRPFFRSSWAYLSIWGCSGVSRAGSYLHLKLQSPSAPQSVFVSLLLRVPLLPRLCALTEASRTWGSPQAGKGF